MYSILTANTPHSMGSLESWLLISMGVAMSIGSIAIVWGIFHIQKRYFYLVINIKNHKNP
jgi:hypothetical protein